MILRMRALLLYVAASSAFLASPALAAGPSFPCSKATAPDEIAICADDHLSQLDRLANLAFTEVKRGSNKPKALKAARYGMTARSACQDDKGCIFSAQVELIKSLQDLGATVTLPDWAESGIMPGSDSAASGEADGLPTEVGQCVNTMIKRIGSRFTDDINASPDDGSAVQFANDGWQISYDKEPGLLHAEVGDPVMMCLVELPKDCPPGDERGKIYTTTDLRTQESWTLPDSQHTCGGA
jgi:uncharacterized protein